MHNQKEKAGPMIPDIRLCRTAVSIICFAAVVFASAQQSEQPADQESLSVSGEATDSLTAVTDSGAANLPADNAISDTAAVSVSPAAIKPSQLSDSSGSTAVQGDTAARFYDHPFFSIGTGWTLGSMPLLDEWVAGLPDSIGDMPGYYPVAELYNAGQPKMEPPDAYNTAFPFSISFMPLIRGRRSLAISASMWWMSKEFQGLWETDSLMILWHVQRELSVMAGSIGCSFYYRIPAEYFSIANIDRAFLVLGLSASPYVRITDKRSEYSAVTSLDNSSEHKYRGNSVSWQAGISTFRSLTDRSAIEIGILYAGQWVGRFMKNDHHVKWAVINETGEKPGDPLSFMAHRLQIYFNIMIGRKPRTPPAEPAPANEAASVPANEAPGSVPINIINSPADSVSTETPAQGDVPGSQ
jgi:hypothetical protein